MKQKGFTLVELLVVMAVIAILAATLLSVLATATEKGRSTQCLSNLCEWGAAFRMYADDNDDFLPRRGQGVQTLAQIDRPTDWFNALPVYFGLNSFQWMVTNKMTPPARAKSIFICPTAQNPGGTYFLPYGMNMNLCPWNLVLPTQYSQVKQPVYVVAMADAPGPYASTYPSKQAYGVVARHRGQINLLFLGGQAQSFAGPYVGCGAGDPGLATVRWLTGTASDVNASNYQ
ncbi:MAG TPA: type II secretion system protein [Pseudomonadales bacterium]|nr:type II secretion system protein [Pseudomonadales bacterium]